MHLQIATSKDIGDVRLDFFKYAVPRVETLMAFSSKHVYLDLVECSRFSMIVIFHSMDNTNEIGKVVEKLVNSRTLSTQTTSQEGWRLEFVKNLLSEDHLYFRTTKEILADKRNALLHTVLKQL